MQEINSDLDKVKADIQAEEDQKTAAEKALQEEKAASEVSRKKHEAELRDAHAKVQDLEKKLGVSGAARDALTLREAAGIMQDTERHKAAKAYVPREEVEEKKE